MEKFHLRRYDIGIQLIRRTSIWMILYSLASAYVLGEDIKNSWLLLVMGACVVQCIGLAYTFLRRRELGVNPRDKEVLFPPALLLLLIGMFYGKSMGFRGYYIFHLTLFLVLALLNLIAWYLQGYVGYVRSNSEANERALYQVVGTNNRVFALLTVGIAAFAVTLFFLPIWEWTDDVVRQASGAFVAFLKLIFKDRLGESSETGPKEEFSPGEINESTGDGGGSEWLYVLLGGIAIIGLILLFVITMVRLLKSIFRRRQYDVTDEVISVRLDVRRKGKAKKVQRRMTEEDGTKRRIRRLFRNVVEQHYSEGVPRRTPKQLLSFCGDTGETLLRDMYEKARYSDEQCSGEEYLVAKRSVEGIKQKK